MTKALQPYHSRLFLLHLPVADGAHGDDDGGVVLVLLLEVVPGAVLGVDVPQPSHVLEGGDQRLQLVVLILLIDIDTAVV